jgi:hypothetical protein
MAALRAFRVSVCDFAFPDQPLISDQCYQRESVVNFGGLVFPMSRCPDSSSPPRHFFNSHCKQKVSPNRPLRAAWETLAWPLGRAWVALGRPNPKPNPSRNRQWGRYIAPMPWFWLKTKEPMTKGYFFKYLFLLTP